MGIPEFVASWSEVRAAWGLLSLWLVSNVMTEDCGFILWSVAQLWVIGKRKGKKQEIMWRRAGRWREEIPRSFQDYSFYIPRICFPRNLWETLSAFSSPLLGCNSQFWKQPLGSSGKPAHGLLSSLRGEQNIDPDCGLWSRLYGFKSWHYH